MNFYNQGINEGINQGINLGVNKETLQKTKQIFKHFYPHEDTGSVKNRLSDTNTLLYQFVYINSKNDH